MLSAERALRNALGAYPTGVAVVTAKAPDDELLGVTIGSFTSVSLDPPLVSFSLGKSLFSLNAFLEVNHFAINVLSEEQMHISQKFASGGADKWAGIDPEWAETGCPILSNNLAVFECKMHTKYDGGDHIIFLGRVLHYSASESREPLVFFKGRYCGIQSNPT